MSTTMAMRTITTLRTLMGFVLINEGIGHYLNIFFLGSGQGPCKGESISLPSREANSKADVIYHDRYESLYNCHIEVYKNKMYIIREEILNV
jgi:hypothetical protein